MENRPVAQNICQAFSQLARTSTWHADRARRIFDSGCPKDRVREICAELSYFTRDHLLEIEERKLMLMPMAMSGSFNPPALQTEQHAILVGEYKKMEYQVGHQARIIERMKEREEWFQDRITQLEKFGSTVATELSEMKKKHPEPPPSSDGSLSPLVLGTNSSLEYHEHIASVCRKSVLEEDNMVGGMTPTLPLLPIPTHSLKKQVSWHNIEASADVQGADVQGADVKRADVKRADVQKEESEDMCRDSEFFVYSQEGSATHRPSVGGAAGLI